jgi:hypothetical protein
MYFLKSENASYGINLPTKVSEVTKELLSSVTDHVKIAPYNCIIAVGCIVKLSSIAMSVKPKNTNIRVYPSIAKLGSQANIGEVGDKVIVPASIIEQALQLPLPLANSFGGVSAYIDNDSVLRNELSSGNYSGNLKFNNKYDFTEEELKKDNQTEVMIFEFKIVNVNHIQACINPNVPTNDPFYIYGESN